MICPHCASRNFGVKDTRKTAIKTWRRLKCLDCRTDFHSIEIDQPLMEYLLAEVLVRPGKRSSLFLQLLDEMKTPSMNAQVLEQGERRKRKRKAKSPKKKKVDKDWHKSDKAKGKKDAIT